MAKDKKPIFFDDVQWGNQETDSVSHDDMLEINWNKKRTKALKEHQAKVITQKYKDKDYKEKWSKANNERWEDPEYRKFVLERMNEGRTPEVEQRRIEAVRNSEKRKKSMADRWADPEFRKKIAKANSKPMSQEHKDILRDLYIDKPMKKETVKKRMDTYNERQMSNQKVNKQCRSVHTPEGVFNNFALIVKHFGISKNTIIRRCKNQNPKYSEWYYID